MTKVIKIYLPSQSDHGVGEITSAIRDEVLNTFENGQISYSFSSTRASGYVMIYPTQPLLSIRVSNHTTHGTVPDQVLFDQQGKVTSINAEMENGAAIMEAFVTKAIFETKERAQDVKYFLNQHNLL